ncbi:uncharacterized protein LY89DRAFT_738400 [Mollisia scopiformis]|uniref:Uncharacterized protein n=1 Tax=Mollisia scopiformis TaxID=149040 RepID=A0A194WYE1_MOLSC|nr:uncharacterized protein LY89DRAFT_738400 [Mollisia scopiformis]KUJ12627.1 hypothetical protein LY89DRAFT_738400 [Mollisia scopiformis]
MTCTSYEALRSTALANCGAGSGYADCACGVYAVSTAGRTCLIATYSYHASGPGVIAPDGNPAEFFEPGFTYNGHNELRRETMELVEISNDTYVPGEVGIVQLGTDSQDNAASDTPSSPKLPYPYVAKTNAEGSATTWSLGYLGSCSSVS